MPIEIKSLEEFIQVASRAIECRVVRGGNKKIPKIKARTRRYLYTYVLKENENIDDIINKIRDVCKNIVEIGSEAKE
ncbi:MAG: hypothetical protein ACP5GI_00870 [Sulfolobales archaeon]